MKHRIVVCVLPMLLACAHPPPAVPSPTPVTVEVPIPARVVAPSPTVTQDEPFRKEPPQAGKIAPFVPPRAVRARLGNGISVVLISFPSRYCAITVFAAGGSADVAPDRPNKVDVVDEMLSAMNRGHFQHDKQDLSSRLAHLLMPYPSRSRFMDGVAFSASVPSDHVAEGAQIMANLALDPSFDPATFERAREQDARALEDLSSDGAKVAEWVLGRVLFGSHLYASVSTATHTRSVTRTDVVSLHERLFRPSRLSIVVAGNVEEKDAMDILEKDFGKVAPGGSEAPLVRPPTVHPGPAIVVVDKPGASTSFIATGFAGTPAGASDETAARMANLIAMNGSIGRGTRLRDELKLVPSTETFTSEWRSAGELGWTARTSTENVAPLLMEAERITHALATDGPTDDEVDVMRNWMTTTVVQAFETPERIAATYTDTIDLGLPDEALLGRPAAVAKTSAADVRAAAARYLDRTQMRVVVVGDLRALREPLEKLGWGPIEVRDATGEIVRSAPLGAR